MHQRHVDQQDRLISDTSGTEDWIELVVSAEDKDDNVTVLMKQLQISSLYVA